MVNLDFISVPFKTYIENHLRFADGLEEVPKIYATNYLNSKLDKKV